MLRDRDVRRLLHERLATEHPASDDVLILDELGLCNGSARIDVAVVNSRLEGYEIKSPADTLDRLRSQMDVYCKVFDRLYLVLGPNHVESALEQVPEWCGLIEVRDCCLHELRPATQNPDIDAYSLARLLWREEALAVLEALGQAHGLRSKPRKVVWKALAECVDVVDMARAVRETIKSRSDWRADSRRTADDATLQLLPM